MYLEQKGLKDYTGQGLLGRLNAFEFMMTHIWSPIFMWDCSFKMKSLRLNWRRGPIEHLLTNALEHPNDKGRTPSKESILADVIKCRTAITVVWEPTI